MFFQSCKTRKKKLIGMSISKQSSYEKPFRTGGQILAAKPSQKLVDICWSLNKCLRTETNSPVVHSIACSFKSLISSKIHGVIAHPRTLHATILWNEPFGWSWSSVLSISDLALFLLLPLLLFYGLALPRWDSVLCWGPHCFWMPAMTSKLQTYK